MISLGSAIFFRWKKYRFVLLIVGFFVFDFSTIIAVLESRKARSIGSALGYPPSVAIDDINELS